MNITLWIVAIALAVAFLGTGLMKQFVPKEKLITSGQGWAFGGDRRRTGLKGLGGRHDNARRCINR